ncbi:MAG TPA: glycosyltransferase [Segetibacter sp.]|nr:glycosyltransferase [Segetibacter sp.]
MPVISVIMPAYNAEKYISESIDSILNQTFKDFEFIIVNNASTDSTVTIINSYNDSRIRIVNNPFKGVSSSLNMGLNLAKGQFIARMDADDIAHVKRFERQLQYFGKHADVDICGSWIQHFGAEKGVLKPPQKHERIKASMLFLNPMFHPAVMFKKESFQKYNLRYDEQCVNAEDYVLWAKAIDHLTFGNVPEVLLKYRIHEENASVLKASNRTLLDGIHFEIYKRLLKHLNIDCSKQELQMQRNLALKEVYGLRNKELDSYIDWIKMLVEKNKQTKYFQHTGFRDTIISYFLLIAKRTYPSLNSFKKIIKGFASLYSFQDYVFFVVNKGTEKIKRAEQF